MMFCPNCGMENEDDAKFCEHCGTELERVTVRLDQQKGKQEPGRDKPDRGRSDRKPRDYKEKIKGWTGLQIVVLAELVCLALVIVILFGAAAVRNTPEAVAKRYLQAYSEENWSKVYDMTAYSHGKFLQKTRFIQAMRSSEIPKIMKFKIKKGKKADINTQKNFTVEYTSKDAESDTLELNLKKQKGNALLGTWKVTSDGQVAKDFCINIPAGASAAVDGIALTDSEKGKSKADGMDSYYVTLFTGNHRLQEAAPWFELYETDFYAVQGKDFTAADLKLTEEGKNAVQAKMQEALERVYKAAIEKKDFSEVSDVFLKEYKDACKKEYSSLVEGMHDDETNTLNQVTFTDFNCELYNDSAYPGMPSAKLTFAYEIKYTNSYQLWGDYTYDTEESGTGDSYMSASFGYDGKTYKLASMNIESVL